MRFAFYILAIVACAAVTGCDIEVDAHASSSSLTHSNDS